MFVALPPATVLDTRNATPVPAAGDLTLAMLGKGGVQVGSNGSIKFHNGSGGTTQVVADTAGYYLS